MTGQYSDSSGPLLALDTASPRISVALGGGGRTPLSREAASGRSSPSLLRMIDELLEEAGISPDGLGGLIAIRGPGSFTGLRVGLSTLLGLHRALELPATAVSTFDALAWRARAEGERVLAVVDALRGEWFSQLFETSHGKAPPRPLEEPRLRVPEELAEAAGSAVITGFGLEALESRPMPLRVAAGPLAPALLEMAAGVDLAWEPRLLTEPLYLRPPATTSPRR